MVSTFSPNKTLELPGFNDYVNSWNVPLNSDMTIIDAALGGSTFLNATSPTGTVTLTFAQYRPLSIIVSGAMTADVFYTIPAGVGGQWTVTNGTTGAFSVYMVSAAGGASVRIPQGYSTIVSCDGGATGMRLSINTPVLAAGSNTQVQYNSSGSFAGSSNLTFNGTTLTAAALTLGSALSAANGGTSLTAAGTTGNVLTSNGTTWTSASAAPTNGYRRNRIINGAMQVDQRNNGVSQVITTTPAYTVDRWIIGPSGASITGQQVAGPTGYQHAYRMTGAFGVTEIDFQQRIESYNVADLVNQNVTLSANISNSLLTTVTWKAYYPNAVDNIAVGFTLIATGTFTVSPTATTYTATFNAGANAANGLIIEFSVGAQTSGNWTVTGVQLEPGTLATPFERQLISDTLAQCQRYYISAAVNSIVFNISMFSGANFPVTMRATPTMTVTPVSGSVSGVNACPNGFYATANATTAASFTASSEL